MSTPEKHGLAKQFTRLIILSGLASFLLLGFLQVVLNKGLRLYFDQPEVQTKASQYQVNELQNYITENSLSSTDIKKLTDWTRSHRYNLLELYRDQKLIYSSYAPRHYYKNNDPEAPELTDSHQHGPFYDWSPVYTLNFSDGEITALLYYNGFDACYSTGCDLLLIICLASFPLFFLWGSRGIVKYIVQLSEEIQAMEGGDLDPVTFDFDGLDGVRLPLIGSYQPKNAALAITALRVLRGRGWNIPDSAIRTGLEQVSWPGRFELLRHAPAFLLDGSHNAHGMRATVQSLRDRFPGQKFVFLLSIMADKDVDEMLALLLPLAKRFVTVAAHTPRAMPAETLAEQIRARGGRAEPAPTIEAGVARAVALGGTGPVCALGTLYFSGDVREAFAKLNQ